MRVLLLNQFYPPDVAATGQYLADLGEGLARRGHEAHVVCSRRGYGGGQKQYAAEEAADGLQVHRVPATGFGRRSLAGRLVDYLSFHVLAAWRALRLPRMDVCVALTTPPFIGLVGALLKRTRGTRLVIWSMDLYPEVPVAYGVLRKGSLLHRALSRLSRWLYGQCCQIISLGEVMTERLTAAGANGQKITTVHNWVPGESVRPMPPEHSSARQRWDINGRVAVMYSGNLGRGHDLETILRGAERLEDSAGVSILFVGNGPMRRRLEKLTDDLRLQCVQFRDPVPLESLGDSLAAGDIHVVSQKPGTQGLIVPSKIYGVLAAGRPTLLVGPEDCEVARIIHKGDVGIVVPPGDVDGAASAIRTLAENADLRQAMGSRARELYATQYGRDRSVSRIMQAIERASGLQAASRPDGALAGGGDGMPQAESNELGARSWTRTRTVTAENAPVDLSRDRPADALVSLCGRFASASEWSVRADLSHGDWGRLAELARRHGLTPLLYRAIAGGDHLSIPAELHEQLKRHHMVQTARNLRALQQLEEIGQALRGTGVPVIVLKGANSLLRLYQDVGCRTMADIDLMVPRKSAGRLHRAMMQLGYRCSLAGSSPDLMAITTEMEHRCPFEKAGSLPVDVHTAVLDRRDSQGLATGEMWAQARPIAPDGTLLCLSPPHFLLHSASHYMKHRDSDPPALSWMVDVALAVHKWEAEIDWPRFWEAAEHWEIDRDVATVMATVGRHWGLSVPLLPDGATPLSVCSLVSTEAVEPDRRAAGTSSAYLHRLLSVRELPTARARLRYLRFLFLPPIESLRCRYGAAEDGAAASLYVRHWATFAARFLRGLAAWARLFVRRARRRRLPPEQGCAPSAPVRSTAIRPRPAVRPRWRRLAAGHCLPFHGSRRRLTTDPARPDPVGEGQNAPGT